MPTPLLIADVPWLLYRSYFALPASITGADGEPVNALLGTVNALLSFFDDARLAARPVRAVVACLGEESASYRVQLYPAYHAQRDADAGAARRPMGAGRRRSCRRSDGRSTSARAWRPTT